MEAKYPPGCIFTFDDIFNDDECDVLIKTIHRYAIIDREVYGHTKNVIADSVNTMEIPDTKVKDLIFGKILNICKTFKNEYDVEMGGFATPSLRRIKGPTRRHKDGVLVDGKKTVSELRNMSIIIALNDDYEGGELCFPEQGYTIKLKKGQAVAFPPYWTHPHYTNELRDNTFRYTVNCWTHDKV
jgi:hypothetical protein